MRKMEAETFADLVRMAITLGVVEAGGDANGHSALG